MHRLEEASAGQVAPADGRRCSRCGAVKAVDEFPMKIRARGVRRTWCRDCCRAYGRAHYEKNKPYYVEKARRREKPERDRVRALIHAYLRGHPCVDCGRSDIAVLEFDHRDRTLKRLHVSRLAVLGSWALVEREIAKCDVRCANCHRVRTAEQFGWAKAIGIGIDPTVTRPGSSGRYALLGGPRQEALFSSEQHGLRRCSRCRQLRPLADFPFRSMITGSKGYYCRACQAAYRRGHYERNRPDYIARAMEEARLKKQDILALVHAYLREHPCVDCGETRIAVLDFDHIDPATKVTEVSKMIGHRNWPTIQTEIAKCVVRCANCHRLRTAEQQSWIKRFGEAAGAYGRIRLVAGVAQW